MLRLLALTGLLMILMACSEEPRSPQGVVVDESIEDLAQPQAQVEQLIPYSGQGSLRISDAADWEMEVEGIKLSCTADTPTSPFTAQWEDPVSGVALKISGFIQEGVDETRIRSFSLANIKRGSEKRGMLEYARLLVRTVEKQGNLSRYLVEADGGLQNGGKFTATGTCVG